MRRGKVRFADLRNGLMLFSLNNGSHTLHHLWGLLSAQCRHPAHHLHQGHLALVPENAVCFRIALWAPALAAVAKLIAEEPD